MSGRETVVGEAHGVLRVRVVDLDQVEAPGHETRYVPRGNGQAAATSLYPGRPGDEPPGARGEAWTSWRSSVRIADHPGRLADQPDVRLVSITFPDGSGRVVTEPQVEQALDAAYEAAALEGRAGTAPAQAEQMRAHRRAWLSKVKVAPVRGWQAELVTGEGDTEVFVLGDDAAHCQRRTLSALDDLARQGWSLVHVSEDRQLGEAPAGPDIWQTRYLLKRGEVVPV